MYHAYLADSLQEILPILPADGIAYRGDPVKYAAGSLHRDSANYMIFSDEKAADPFDLAIELQSGVNFAVQFTYPPEWGQNPLMYIHGDFEGYSNYYEANPSSLPAISWGVSSHERQLAVAKKRGSMFYTSGGAIAVGRVFDDGPVAEKSDSSPVIADLEDIVRIEKSIEVPSSVPSGIPVLRRFGRDRDNAPSSQVEYLAGRGRREFHAALGSIMALKLIEAVKLELS